MNRLLSYLKPVVKLRYSSRKFCHDAQQQIVFCQLQSRQLLSIEGKDSSALLQGLITNDINILDTQLKDGKLSRSQYALMLQSKGRVLFDVLLYSVGANSDTKKYLLECDRNVFPDVVKHLSLYKMRKKLNIIARDDLKSWAIFRPPRSLFSGTVHQVNVSGNDFYTFNLDDNFIKNGELLYKDPRIPGIGYRAILGDGKNPKDIIINVNNFSESTEDDYRVWKYQLGMGEGALDYPPETCLPFDCNVDYLNGVNFHKGCYLGQEIMAKTHYRGVVRRRSLPLIFTADFNCDDKDINIAEKVVDDAGKSLGKFRNRINRFGLAALLFESCLQMNSKMYVVINGNEKCPVSTYKPFWWPADSQVNA